MKVLSNTEIRVVTTWGGVVLFYPGVEKEVGDEIGLLAMQQGAKQIQETTPTPVAGVVEVAAEAVVIEVSADPLLDRVAQICSDLIDEGEPDFFNIDGSPKAKVINERAGEKVSPEIRDSAWLAALNS